MKKIYKFLKNIIKFLFNKIRKLMLWAIIHFNRSYQPVGEIKDGARGRPESAFSERLKVLESEIRDCSANNLLDIGCCEGFFPRQVSLKHNILSLGIDGAGDRLNIGNALLELNEEEGYGFILKFLTPEDIVKLPSFDIVVCFSVLHHIVKVGGESEGVKFLKACSKITKKRFIFDMGGPEETSHSWAKDMEFLKGDVVAETKKFLEKAGFTDVRHVGDSWGHNSDAKRPIFSCKPINRDD